MIYLNMVYMKMPIKLIPNKSGISTYQNHKNPTPSILPPPIYPLTSLYFSNIF